MQVFVIDAYGSDLSEDANLKPRQISHFPSNASAPRWHPSKNWIFAIVNGNIAAICAEPGENFGKTIMLTTDDQERGELVVSNDGNALAYTIFMESKEENEIKKIRQIFMLELDWETLKIKG
jgi:Tol biopolymer transport system component